MVRSEKAQELFAATQVQGYSEGFHELGLAWDWTAIVVVGVVMVLAAVGEMILAAVGEIVLVVVEEMVLVAVGEAEIVLAMTTKSKER